MTRISTVTTRLLAGVALAGSLLLVPAATQAAGVYPKGTAGTDISYPQCGTAYPTVGSFGIVGVGGGKAITHNACFSAEAGWAGSNLSLYMNLNAPVGSTARTYTSEPITCATGDKICQAHNYGWNAAKDAYTYAGSYGASASAWWLDIETANSWAAQTNQNQATIRGAVDYLKSKNVTNVGIYSTTTMWKKITGGWQNTSLPVWYASTSGTKCGSVNSFTGGPLWLIQDASASTGGDVGC